MKGIALCSGGLDSTLALIKLLQKGNQVVPMFVDYGQWALEGEEVAFNDTIEWLITNRYELGFDKFPYTEPVNFPVLKKSDHLLEPVYSQLLLNLRCEDERVGSVWGRNIALVGIAAMWAYTHGDDYDFIALGNHKGDVGPDCKPGSFDSSLHDTLIEATKGKLDLVLPIRSLDIEDIGVELSAVGFPFELAYSCYWSPNCGYKSTNDKYLCPGCRRKSLVMKAAGITGEALLSFPNGKERSYQSPLADKVLY